MNIPRIYLTKLIRKTSKKIKCIQYYWTLIFLISLVFITLLTKKRDPFDHVANDHSHSQQPCNRKSLSINSCKWLWSIATLSNRSLF